MKPGHDLTVVTYGALVQKSQQGALLVERKNPDISVEVIDLRSLAPFDWNAIRTAVEKTNRVIVAHEDCLSFGYGAEIAARIADELFDRLDAPVRRVAALDTVKQDLSLYDTCYLQASLVSSLPLATNDKKLRAAAESCGVTTLVP